MKTLQERIDEARKLIEGLRLSPDELICFSIYSGSASLQVEPEAMERVCDYLKAPIAWLIPDPEDDEVHLRACAPGLEIHTVCDTPQQANDIVERATIFS